MTYVTLETQKTERVGLMTLRYGAENRFHPDFMAEIVETLGRAEGEKEIGALVVTGGDPRFFSNGLDLEWISGHIADMPAVLGYLRTMNSMYKRWTLYPKPVVAALNGHTFAGGLFMAAHMDFRFMREERGWACIPESDINIPLLPGMIAICRAVMTPQGFRQMYYTGKRVTGPEAMTYGFVDAVFPAHDLVPKAVEFAAALAKKRPDTYAEMKRRIRSGIARIIDEVDPDYFESTLAFPMAGA
ncbi:MAG: enoyl-CoA hydratase/isomerase family protein [Deltaproteobacteria bacterium]|nr:enoyl-CoA hydratase/isomerase family protein [Deltaproteobacteria bacterium]